MHLLCQLLEVSKQIQENFNDKKGGKAPKDVQKVVMEKV